MLTKGDIETSVYGSVEVELERVIASLMAVADREDAENIDSDAVLQERLEHILAAPGKRVRPAITLLTSKLWGANPTEDQVTMAAAVELLHIATLVHDDMVDRADLRRGRATPSNLWGGRVAVLLGDYLFAASAMFVCDTGNVRVIKRFAETIMELAKGELTELIGVGDLPFSRDAYYKRIYNKTASLFTTAAESGAILCGASPADEARMHQYGYSLGMAYQVMDDVLDFTSTSEELGKPACNDLRQGILTLPSIILLERSPENNPVTRLLNGSTDDREIHLEQAVNQMRATGIFDECIAVADDFVRKATESLQGFEDSEARTSLHTLATFASNRLN
ncbi:MAG: polyprenyl synthetase family protein [Chloroflexi bacterium]|nr:polyprenyl synthetase family protein [Chloroflexota bacterium]